MAQLHLVDQRDRPQAGGPPLGLAVCLADVLAKVSSDATVLNEPRLAALRPETLIADYDYVDRVGGLPHRDEEGSSDRPFWLTVRFDPARLDAALHELGRIPFTGPRATVVPVVTVRRADTLFVLTSDAPQGADHRAALAAAADRVDIAMRLPTAAEIADQIAQTADILPLTGVLTWSAAAHGWVANWVTEWQGHAHQWEARGISFDEAYRVGMRGALGLMAGFPPGRSRAVASIAEELATVA